MKIMIDRTMKARIILLTCCGIALLVWFLIYLSINMGESKRSYRRDNMDQLYGDDTTMTIFEGERIVHMDLKGAPPKISYFKEFFKLIKELGATGVIIEYEDMFPYHGQLRNVSAGNAYSRKDIRKINSYANETDLKIIPLVQTFGHLEFLLKSLEFQHLREVRKYPQVICPSNDKTLPLLIEMINQVIKAHPNSKIIHIGADEVYLIGQCPKCFDKILNEGITKETFFLKHIISIASEIKKQHPDLKLLIWDDELRKMKYNELRASGVSKYVEPVIWSYVNDVSKQIGPQLWDLYSQIFNNVWIASAFKGATGSNKYITDANYHLQNHRSWMKVVNENSKKVNVAGIILTGWQRYDHFAVLCELLPVGIPSLALCLHLLRGIQMSPFEAPHYTAQALQCKNSYGLLGTELGSPKCQYPGAEILDGVLKIYQLNQELDNTLDSSVVKGWMTSFNIKHKYSNIYLIESTLENLNLLRMELFLTEKELKRNMQSVYDDYTITEWCDTYLEPIFRKMQEFLDAKNTLLDLDTWPKKPFPIVKNKN